MLERYDVIISEGAPDPMLPQVEGDWVRYADAQATIADLQGQLKAQAEEYEQVEQCLDEQISGLNQGNLDYEKKIAALQQRVAQLEGQLSTPTWVCDGCGRVSREGWITIVNETLDGIDYDMECPSCGVREIEEDSAADLVRELERLEDQLTTLQADHARVLGLVQALPVVGLPAEHARPDDFILLKTGEGWMAHTYNYWAKFATEEEARAYIALLEYRASLPAQRAKLAQGGV